MRNAHCVRKESGEPVLFNGQRLLPIIPLVGTARAECYKPAWPRYTVDDLAKLTKRIERRVDVVLDRLVGQYWKSNNLFVRFFAKLILGRKKEDIVEFAREKITADLGAMGLM